eukprot:4868750-Prymnesium_polylepis.1
MLGLLAAATPALRLASPSLRLTPPAMIMCELKPHELTPPGAVKGKAPEKIAPTEAAAPPSPTFSGGKVAELTPPAAAKRKTPAKIAPIDAAAPLPNFSARRVVPTKAHARFDFGEADGGVEEQLALDWRHHPERSLSDWTIVVERECGREERYHVHKVMLAAGAQPSDYFKCIFGAAAATVDEGTSHTSRLSLADSAADAFP